MKKFLFLMTVLCVLGTTAVAQDVFRKGNVVGNVQVGIGAYKNYGVGFPISASVDVGAFDRIINGENGSIGLGGYVGFASYNNTIIENALVYDNSATSFVIGLRGTFHYQLVDNLDTYAGFMAGVNRLWTNNSITSQLTGIVVDDKTTYNSTRFASAFFVGARYYFTNSFGVVAEAGYGFANCSIGITFKF